MWSSCVLMLEVGAGLSQCQEASCQPRLRLILMVQLSIDHCSKTQIVVSNNKKDDNWQNNLIDHINDLYHSQDFNKIRELSNQFDKTVISAVLKLTNGKKVQSSEILGLGRNTLTRKIFDLKINT